MKIGMPKEIKENEFRVAIVPHNVSKLTSSGHQVYVETEAGLASGFTDEQYVKAGAEILPDAASVYKAGDMIVKVKEFLPPEFGFLEERHILCTYIHSANRLPQTKAILDSKAVAFAYEDVKDEKGGFPLLEPMSGLAGETGLLTGLFYSFTTHGGSGKMICGNPGIKPMKIVIFGAGQTFRAGTVGTLADKTAFGYVKNYYEEHGQGKRKCEIDRIVQGCTGIRRSTGQHPGGIIVLPLGEEINSFTPVQHPANDMTTDIVTTHFDYHSIDHNLLKLDILGHDDPTMIKTLEEYISSPAMDNEYNETDNRFDATKIPLDDQGVISLFHDTSALGIKPDDIGGCPVGCLGIPEFGTDFVIQMVVDTKPNTISDLIRISGLSHGTDVWLNNAQELIRSGKATISTAICTRDDIMTYLINKGMDSEESFTIMERVRKGTVAKGKCKEWPEFKKDMAEHNVPDWYVWSCEQIKYMFPKAHAAAYVMMAYRIAYCKINYPLAYYGAYFGIRADAFSYEIMCQGKEKLQYYIDDYNRRSATLSKKEQDTMKDMKIVQEMYARGFEFEPLDIYKAQATKFLIVNGKLMPPLSSIDGMGEKAAEAVAEASKDGTYLSLDDFRQRTKASKTVIDTMVDLGILADLPASNQLSLFDF